MDKIMTNIVYILSMLQPQYILIHLLYQIHITQNSGICGNTCFVIYFDVCLFLCVCESASLKLCENNLDVLCELLGSISQSLDKITFFEGQLVYRVKHTSK